MVQRRPSLFTKSITGDDDGCPPPEVPWLRGIGVAMLLAFVVTGFAVDPGPSLDSARGIAILAGTLVFAGLMATALPLQPMSTRERFLRLGAVAVVTVGLEALQPDGLWFA